MLKRMIPESWAEKPPPGLGWRSSTRKERPLAGYGNRLIDKFEEKPKLFYGAEDTFPIDR